MRRRQELGKALQRIGTLVFKTRASSWESSLTPARFVPNVSFVRRRLGAGILDDGPLGSLARCPERGDCLLELAVRLQAGCSWSSETHCSAARSLPVVRRSHHRFSCALGVSRGAGLETLVALVAVRRGEAAAAA